MPHTFFRVPTPSPKEGENINTELTKKDLQEINDKLLTTQQARLLNQFYKRQRELLQEWEVGHSDTYEPIEKSQKVEWPCLT